MILNEPEDNYITGYINLYRSFIKWEWFEVPNMVTVFIYCLLKANFKDKNWRGVEIKRGQFITSLETMRNETKLSTQKIRTCLDKLEKTKEINKQSNNQFTIITICKYDSYQSNQETTNKQLTNEQQTDNKRITTTNNDNKEKNVNNKKEIFNFRKEMIDFGFNETLVVDWLKVRKTKKATNTQTALNGFINEIKKCDLPKNDILKICIERSWSGFKSSWFEKEKSSAKKEKVNAGQLLKEKYGID